MRVAFSTKLTVALCVGLGVLALVGAFGYYSTAEFSSRGEQMRRLLDLKGHLETLRQDVDRAELAQLRYELTESPADDIEFGQIALRIVGEVEVMRGKLAEPDQKVRIDRLRDAVQARFDLLAEAMEQRRAGTPATALLFGSRGVAAGKEVQGLIVAIGARQSQLTEDSAERIERQAWLMLHLAVWGAAFAVVLLTWSIYFVIRYERDRQRAERALKNAQERLAFALDGSNSAAWDWDLPGNQIYLSAGWARMLGGEPRENTIAPTALLALVHPDDIKRVHCLLYTSPSPRDS